ncbi:hypothetical protein OG978_34925 [Streptomyces sp. NBC_01591]|uniref:hypothetical protein n=1 Tax=Streptomyces sp. NBC_01591 TaxID=2975888 RepID=UPI002DD8EA24|nr:hypothetical protein [Streptomyces sp. NBC_01591]WSD72134.1 hypothetical protein OG978_34925 [Streptomyces sp. NBC_01591]
MPPRACPADHGPRARPGAPAHRGTAQAARLLLAALLLAVLTVVGSTPAAAGSVLPARPFAGVPPSAAYSPGAHQPTPHTDRTARTGTVHDTRRTRTATATDHDRYRPQTAPPPQPRAGSDQARTAHHLPPPGPDLLLTGVPGIPAPDRAHRPVPAAPPRATNRSRVALPGVRGPPWTAVHRPPVLPPVPSRRTAVPSSPR